MVVGGILIAIKDKFVSSKLNIYSGSLELFLLKLIQVKKIILSYIYFRPNSTSSLSTTRIF